ncbi:MAG: CotH kinase family protein [Clostridia bacterium]|nr:CotH kinase family protein [Clostridia bacterium]
MLSLLKDKKIKCFLCCMAVFVFLGMCAFAKTEQEGVINWETMCSYGKRGDLETKINVQNISGVNTLVMPSACTPEQAFIYVDLPHKTKVTVSGKNGKRDFVNGISINLKKLCDEPDYTLKFTSGSQEYDVKIVYSQNIPALYINSDNVFEKGRPWVESSVDKSNKATGTMVMQKSDGKYVHSGKLTQIKGRGNTTWGLVKKPYQIKLDEKIDLLETGNDKNKTKTWVLLANYLDGSVTRNSLALDLGRALGMETNIESRHVDLYYDGEYRGNYLLSEKVEVAQGRVNITNLEDENAACNLDGNFENLPVATQTTANGAVFTYCEGMKSPKDITGGYLIEMDYEVRALKEICYFKTTRGQYVVVKSPEYASREEMDYIATLYQDYEDAVYNGGVNPTTGKTYDEYVDAGSVARYLLVNEFTKSRDCFKSSAYLYKDKGSEKLTMGPLWDYDMSFGKGGDDSVSFDLPQGLSTVYSEFALKLLENENFFNIVKQVYNENLYPCIKEYFLKDTQTASEQTLFDVQVQVIKDSAACNGMMWHPETDWNNEIHLLKLFASERLEVLKGILNSYESFDPTDNNFKPGTSQFNRYIDVLPSYWFFDVVSKASQLGFVRGMGSYCFEPYLNVQRSHIVQVIYNISGGKDVEFKEIFSDVSSDAWYAGPAIWATENGICNWKKDGMFCPDELATRGEVVMCLYNYAKPQMSTSDNCLEKFVDKEDISPDAVDAFKWAISNELISGYEDSTLRPDGLITRAELAAVLVRYNEVVK